MTPCEDFEAYVAARLPALRRTAYLLTGHHQDAEDLVQVALLKSVGAWPRIVGNPDAYVRQVLVRENISRWRRRRWREVADVAAERPGVGEDVERRLAMRDALMSLPPRQRAVIVLRYYDDLTEAQTAAMLGIRLGTVKSQARDALTRLRTLVAGLDRELEPL